MSGAVAVAPKRASFEDFCAAAGGAVTVGNQASLLTSEAGLFKQLFRLVGGATRRLDVRFYRIHDDRIGRRFVAALIAARERGVVVRLLLDDFGGLEAGDLPDTLRQAGCQVLIFNPVDGGLDPKGVVRDHGKLVVADGERAWVASANVGDDYAVRWHDAGLLVQGPIVGALLEDFDEIWDGVSAGVIPLRSSVALPRPAVPPEERGTLPMRVVANGFDGYATWPHVRAMLAAAGSRVVVSHCYLTDERVIALLMARATAGVKVVVVAPRASDVPLVDLVMHNDVRRLLDAGVRYYHFAGMSHRKLVLVDDRWLFIGSANLDALSLDLNLEVGVAAWGSTFGRLALARIVATYIRQAVRLRTTPLAWWRRVFAWFAERLRDFL